MPKGYRHLTHDQRCQIYTLLKSGFSQSQIAQLLDVSQSTISREIRRNAGKRGYRYKQAHTKAEIRRYNASSGKKKLSPDLVYYIELMLKERQWNPEQISGRLKLVYGIRISHELIYQYIWTDKKSGGMLYTHLRRQGKKYNKRGNKTSGRGLIPNRVGIENRPDIVDQKARIGDFEVDTIIGAHHKGAILSLVERKSKLTRLKILPRATAEDTKEAIICSLEENQDHAHTITADNGKEFAQHQAIASELGVDVYFAQPYCSWERGLNENTNGLIRQYFPKACRLDKLTQTQVRKVEYLLNTRPRKTLNYRTPLEVFFEATGKKLNYALRG